MAQGGAAGSGIWAAGLLQAAFIVLKLREVIDWPRAAVLLPAVLAAALAVTVIAACAALKGIVKRAGKTI